MSSFRSLLHRHSRQGMRFILCGGTGAVIDLSTLTFLVRSGFNEHAASAVSSLLSVLFIFLANKYFTFRNKERKHAVQALKFALVYGLAYVFNVSVTSFLSGTRRALLHGESVRHRHRRLVELLPLPCLYLSQQHATILIVHHVIRLRF